MPIILLIGCVGNSLNVSVFTKGRFRHTLDEIERSAATGLVALAVSNLTFCAVGLPAVLFSANNPGDAATLWNVIEGEYRRFSPFTTLKNPLSWETIQEKINK